MFRDKDTISGFEDLDEHHCPPGYQFKGTDDYVIYYKLEFDSVTSFPNVFGSICVDRVMHLQLQSNGTPCSYLCVWFITGTDAKFRTFSQLENFPKDIKNAANDDHYSFINELENRRHFKPKGRPPYSAAMMRYALLLRYTSLQAYKLLLGKFPLPSISLLNKLQTGGLESIKCAKLLLERCSSYVRRDVFAEVYSIPRG